MKQVAAYVGGAIGALTMVVFAMPVYAVVLDFDGNICNGGSPCTALSPIDQTYGDISGKLDVIYDASISTTTPDNLFFWATGFSDLTNVAYGNDGATAEVFLNPSSGFQVTLNSFDLGAYNGNRVTQWTILDGLGTELASSGPITVSGTTATTVSPGLTSPTGFQIQWGPDAYNVAIDNIDFTVVPLPAALPLFLSALAGFGLMARRRNRLVA